jgi:tetratricopeptide (TPR) repeat protein
MRVCCIFFGVLLLSVFAPGQSSPPSGQASAESPAIASALQKIEQNHFDEAIAELRPLEASDPNQPGLEHALGVAYFRKGAHADAVPHLKRATEQDANDQESVQLLGLSYYFLGRPKDAIPLLERVQSWFPNANVDASYLLGISYLRITDYENARKAFARMYGVGSDSAAGHVILARMLLREGYDPVAEREALKAAELDPKLPGTHFLLGELYVYKSQIEKGISEFNAELAINPLNAPALYKLADAYSRIMKFDDAQKLLQRSIWLDSTASGPFVLMAKVLLKKGQSDLAVRAAQKALSMDPNNYYGHFLLGQAYKNLGKTAQADSEMKLSQELQARQTHSDEELKPKSE